MAEAAQKVCWKELRDDDAAYIKKMRAQSFYNGARSQRHGPAATELTEWLRAGQEDIIRHEEAHAKAAGNWFINIEYLYYRYWDVSFATSGCAWWKGNAPLEVSLRALLAPEQPSDYDIRAAEETKKEIEIKKARAKCNSLRNISQRPRCLAPYSDYVWLDYFPLHDRKLTREELKIRKLRVQCKRILSKKHQNRCLNQYGYYWWVDDYPLN